MLEDLRSSLVKHTSPYVLTFHATRTPRDMYEPPRVMGE